MAAVINSSEIFQMSSSEHNTDIITPFWPYENKGIQEFVAEELQQRGSVNCYQGRT